MRNVHADFLKALAESPESCPITNPAPINYYRDDQIHDCPRHLRGLVALVHQIETEPEFEVFGPRFQDKCTLKQFAEMLMRDALGCPPKTNIAFYSDWKVLAVRPEDQSRFIA